MLEVTGATVAVDKYWRALSARQHYDWPGLVRKSKTVKPNIAPGYSSGQIASRSQQDNSAQSFGLASCPLRSRCSRSLISRFFKCDRRASRISADRFSLARRRQFGGSQQLGIENHLNRFHVLILFRTILHSG